MLREVLEEVGFDVQEETKGFVMPPGGYDREEGSLLNYAKRNTFVGDDPIAKQAGRLLAKRCGVARVLIPDDWNSRERIKAAIAAVDRKSSPGYPFVEWFPGKKNGEVIDEMGDQLVDLVVEALKFESQWPTRLFVKWEPHKKNKIDSNMERLISSIGLIEQIRDRVMFEALADALMAAFPMIPVATGWSDKKGRFNDLLNRLAARKSRILSMDKSSWDWTVTLLTLTILISFIENMVVFESITTEKLWLDYLHRWAKLMFGPGHKLVLSSGKMFEQTMWGIWKSGGFLTLVGNAIMNAGLDIYAQLKMGRAIPVILDEVMAAFGDDTIQTIADDLDVDAYKEALRSAGAVIKDEEFNVSDSLIGHSFCGHQIKEFLLDNGRKVWGLVPERLGKMLANLMQSPRELIFEILADHKANWVNDIGVWQQLHKAQLLMCRRQEGWSGREREARSYRECMEIAYGTLVTE